MLCHTVGLRNYTLFLAIFALGLSSETSNRCLAAAGIPDSQHTDEQLLSTDRIFGNEEEFKADDWGPAYWLKDSSGYTTLESSVKSSPPQSAKGATGIKSIVRYAVDSPQREVLVRAKDLMAPGQSKPLEIKDYEFSDDRNKVLILTNTKRVWRKESRGDYWLFDLKTRALKKLGDKAEPSTMMYATLAADGTRVAYVRENNLFVQSLNNFRVRQLTFDGSPTLVNGIADWVNEEEFGIHKAFRWSPDGKHIAYWQFDTSGVPRFQLINYTDTLYPQIRAFAYPKAGETNSACRIGVLASGGGKTRWLAPKSDPRNTYIPAMEWSKDSRKLYFQQLNRLQNTNEFISADPKRGATEVLLTDRDDAWVENMDEVRWVSHGKAFLWLSERDGWKHLYLVSAADKSLRLLTPGPFDVLSIAGVDNGAGQVYFMASPDNPTQRYLYRAPLDGSGGLTRVSPASQQGTHSYDFSEDGHWAFHTFSRFGQPPVIELVQLPDHKVVRVLAQNKKLNEKLAALKPCSMEFFRVNVRECPPLDAWCIKPPEFDPAKRYPLLIHVYGEPAGTTVVDKWGGENYLFHLMLAQRGYVVASIDNRGTPAPRGREWRKSVYRQIGVLASADQAAATRAILAERPYLDPARVGIWGWSGGGSMSLNAIFRYPELYRTAIAVAFVANQRFYDTIYQERYMGLPVDNEAGFKNGSPITFAHQLKGNLLLVYGTGDDNCHYQNCEVLANELIKHNKAFDQMPYPNRTHAIKEGDNTRRHLYGTLARYLEEKMPARPGVQP